jgi:exo-beta-1,3-glucanase (GH17 family)
MPPGRFMPLLISLFVVVAAAIVGVWSWLGAPVQMPPSPLAANQKLYCVSYAPFRGQQNPLDATTVIDTRQIEDDLARLAGVTDCIRTYSIEHGLEQIAGIAARHGLKVMQGIWVSSNPAKTGREIEAVVALAKRYPDVIRSVIVGNEVLLRGEMTGSDLAALIRNVKSQVQVPVTYADVWEFWLRHPQVYDAVDFVTIHILPYWEDFPISAEQSAAHVDSIRRRVLQSYSGKEILIGETGWPSAGRMREGALPSPANQARVIHEVLAAANRGQYRVNVIEAFDQPWKRWLEGTVGGHWGLLDADIRQPKFTWGEPVSNHPQWGVQAGGGVVLAAIVFAAAWFGRRANTQPAANAWLAIAVIAFVAGALIGWTIEKALIESLGVGGWVRSAVLVGLAIAGPITVAVAWMQSAPLPSFSQVLGGENGRPAAIVLALGLTLAVLCVMALHVALALVFDPRYRDFPFTALTAASLPFLLLVFRCPPRGGLRAAELASAGVLGLSAVYIVLNESFANWQALWFAGALIALVATLLRAAAARSSR